MKFPGIIIAASMLAAANAEPRRLRKEGMRRLQPDAPPVETSQGEYIEVGVDPPGPAFQAKAEKSMSMGTARVVDAKAGTWPRLFMRLSIAAVSWSSHGICTAPLTLRTSRFIA